jgi:Flp pilus assembly CpaE family ATPase
VYQRPSLRLALGLGDQALEQRLRPALDATDDLLVVAQCLAADQLVQAVDARQVDAVVVAWSLHRLTDAVLAQLEVAGVPVIVLAPNPADQRWQGRAGPVLPLDVDAALLRQTLLDARRGQRVVGRPRPAPEPVVLKAADAPSSRAMGTVLAVTGGVGSPGRTTLALNLATALGAVAPTVLVEADLSSSAVAAYLDRDPTQNVCTLAHAVREDDQSWARALADELQPLNRFSPSGVVLCGPPKREMRASIAPAFVERLVAELGCRYRWVILDVGHELLGIDTTAASHRAALASAQHVLLATACDLVGLWHARTALDQLERQLGVQRHTINLLLNRHDTRFHHDPAEVEWHLGAPVACVVPFDHAAAERAVIDQRPLIADSTSRASRSLLQFAERLIGGGPVRLPAAPAAHASQAAWWSRWLPRQRRPVARGPISAAESLQVVAPGGRRSEAW